MHIPYWIWRKRFCLWMEDLDILLLYQEWLASLSVCHSPVGLCPDPEVTCLGRWTTGHREHLSISNLLTISFEGSLSFLLEGSPVNSLVKTGSMYSTSHYISWDLALSFLPHEFNREQGRERRVLESHSKLPAEIMRLTSTGRTGNLLLLVLNI